MPLANLDVLVSEVERQSIIALDSAQQTLPGSHHNAEKSIVIERQDHSYYLDLKGWCQTFGRADETDWGNVVIPEKFQSYLWKLLAFSNSSSPVIDPKYQQTRCRNIKDIRAKDNNLKNIQTEDIWQAAGLRSWATCPVSSVVIIQGTSQTIRCLEAFSYEISLKLVEMFPTIWMLSEPSSREFVAAYDETELLRQLAIQALQQITYFKASLFIEILCLFKNCKSSHDWFHILKTIFQALPKVYVIVDLNILGARNSRANNWPDDFQTLISQLSSNCSSNFYGRRPENDHLKYTQLQFDVLSVLMSTDIRVDNQPGCNSNAVLGAKRTCHNPILGAPNRSNSASNRSGLENSCDGRERHDKTPHRNDITVAVICALPLEANAVLAVFNNHWDIQSFGNLETDKNAYSLGRIGCHNVVLVHMPGMGRAAAATVAASCRTSFPSIRVALIVGICGAIPFHNLSTEILLGDVIISDRLVVYDFGRQFPDKFVRKDDMHDSARKPPEEIQNFLSKMKVPMHHNRLQDSTGSYLKTLVESKLAPYPGAKEDRLFQPSYRHQHQKASECFQCASTEPFNGVVCDTARTSTCNPLGCDPTRLVVRRRHSQIINNFNTWLPLIHFGAYASGDTVMKSGEHRDQIAEREQVIAFEMEGAGVWEILPCVIIKGVCDYADSHKNKQWQNYAAVTAAACLKAFLEVWPISRGDSNSGLN
ncbi:hypothetical protein RRF57_001573 [Xylaria bambusicola]|uniref:Nucleoside phosphorylase domain-containing protein n=1 Tax=Xylaria bambusicola TaxID=326684 RepID=A0AAN7UE08_9PEZI